MFPSLLLALFAAASTPTPRPWVTPAGWTAPALPPDNPLTLEAVELGRLLFADRRLSARHRQNCLNCHRESLAFADGDAFSTGADGIQGTRSPRAASRFPTRTSALVAFLKTLTETRLEQPAR